MLDLSALHDAIALLERGGPVMAALLLISVVAVAIVLVKIYQFSASRMRQRDFVDPALTMVHEGDYSEAVHFLAQHRSPLARVMETAVRAIDDARMSPADREAEIGRVGSAELRNLETHLRGLELIANLSPLLGLLGTVIGMIRAFARLEEAGTRVDPSILAGGIWEALLTTAVGLIVAIPALAAYHLLQGEIDRLRSAMSDVGTRLLTYYGRGDPYGRRGLASGFADAAR